MEEKFHRGNVVTNKNGDEFQCKIVLLVTGDRSTSDHHFSGVCIQSYNKKIHPIGDFSTTWRLEKFVKLYDSFEEWQKRLQPGPVWVKASTFAYVAGDPYHAKDNESKGAGSFDATGNFTWGDGSVTPHHAQDDLLILDESPAEQPVVDNARYELSLALRMLLKVFKNDQITNDQEKYYSQAEAMLKKHSKVTDVLRAEQPRREIERDPQELWDAHSEYIEDNIDDLSRWAGSTVMTKKAFYKAMAEWSGEKEVKEKEQVVIHNNSDAFRNWVSDIKGYPFALLGHCTGVWLPPGVTLEMFEGEWEAYERANNPAKREVKP